jgi:hypothetical protein
LLAGVGFKSHHRIGPGRRALALQVIPHQPQTAAVPQLAYLPKKNRGRNPVRACRSYPLIQMSLERIELGGSLRSPFEPGLDSVSQILPDSIGPYAVTLFVQNSDFHNTFSF